MPQSDQEPVPQSFQSGVLDPDPVRALAAQRAITYYPRKDLAGNQVPPIQDPQAYGLTGIEAKLLKTTHGEEFLTWQSEKLKAGRKTLVLFPGNFGHLGHPEGVYTSLIDAAQKEGYQIMAVNHIGFAGSKAQPTLEGLFREVETTLEILQKKGIRPQDMHIVGQSMGTTLAAHAAKTLANSWVFGKNRNEHIFCLLNNGIVHANVIIDEMMPDKAEQVKAAWQEKFDTAAEFQGIKIAKERVHTAYLRGESDPWTPANQVEAHAQAAQGLDFVGKAVPGEHYLTPDVILSQFKEMAERVQKDSRAKP